jgi:hypothetical protein
MIDNIPTFVSATFILTTIATLLLFLNAVRHANAAVTREQTTVIALGLSIWLILQMILSLKNIYNTDTYLFPPKFFLFGVLPTLLLLITMFTTQRGKIFVDSLLLKHLAYLNIVRIPVEIVLFWLFLYKAVPVIMTFEGRNFDILAGITAPFIAYFGFSKKIIPQKLLLLWHFVCVILLLNIVVIAVLALPISLQQFGFEQPNIAVLNFPFSWLPSFIVPIVLFGHLTSIRQLMRNERIK